MFDLKSKAREVIERGYCVLESVYDNREREQMCAIFKQLCDETRTVFRPSSRPSVFTRSWSGDRRCPLSLQRRLL